MVSQINLAEMLCTRLCHDLTGPIGAVNNGAEFLEDEGFDMQSDAMQLVLSSAAEAVHRLQFYRQAYGRTGEQGEVSLSQQKQLVDDFFSTTKIKMQWPQPDAYGALPTVSLKFSRLILNLLIIVSGALIKGGTIALDYSEDEQNRSLSVKAVGDVIKLDENWLKVLKNEATIGTLTPKTAQLVLTMQLLEELGANLQLHIAEGELSFRVSQKVVASEQAQAYCA